jgi:hypothetical protein
LEKTFYDRHGRPIAYTEDRLHIYLFDGTPVGYFDEESIYSYRGIHLGRYEDGWVRDNSGRCVFFTENVTGSGPVQPVKHVKPVKHVNHVLPVKYLRHVKPVRPVNMLAWSDLSGDQFFYQ